MFARLMKDVLPEFLEGGADVLMAVSGGPDSMAMADILCRYAGAGGAGGSVRLAAVHINHGLRQEAEEEEGLVRAFAQERDLSLSVHRFDAMAYAQSVHKPLQDAARQWRYRCFASVMEELGFTSLATAHHMNDQAETLVYRFLRGSGTLGLAGIWPDRVETGWSQNDGQGAHVQGIHGQENLKSRQMRLIRPLLSVSKEEIFAYCHERGISYALDKSNESGKYIRNRIRLELIPHLEQHYNPRLQEVLNHTAEVLRWDEAYFQSVVAEKWSLYGRGVCGRAGALLWTAWQEPEAILSRLLRRAMALVRQEPRGMEQRFVKGLMMGRFPRGWSQDLPGLRVVATEEAMVFLSPSVEWTQADVANGFCHILANGPGDDCDRSDDCDRLDECDRLDDCDCPEKHISLVLVPNVWQEVKDRINKERVSQIGLFSEDMAERIGLMGRSDVRVMAEIVLDQETGKGLRGPFEYRGRRPGDRVFAAGVGHKRLKKVWQEHGVPGYLRDGFKVLAVGFLVLAIPGLGVVSRLEGGEGAGRGVPARWVLMSRVVS
ncbi:MAG: tRNA lysidine(34) synthetase TilS [Peptococcaceae bacterium]|nr:tRNA lysidine(34) synthetase TilS [Peptococcaceae bacterium]